MVSLGPLYQRKKQQTLTLLKYMNDLAKQQLTYSIIDEYWSLIVTIDEQAQNMLEFVMNLLRFVKQFLFQKQMLNDCFPKQVQQQIREDNNRHSVSEQFGNYKEEYQGFQVR
ncbi:Hypothetical_protein [Hexamita inflata]|uniref:Hypothetical_protein n=1 Tax=Hexamita inflata TaxID=28002 RepID=A0AA86UQN8_9EUKA|nr:Hypothetical protein HINF_LOCUS55530 [Hexamita inflata]